MQVSPGTKVAERYVIEKALAKGGMGAVFIAQDEQMGVRVALKVTVAGGAAADEFSKRFQREARIGNRLGARHQGFVRCLGWGRVDDVQLYLVMDLVEGARPLDLRQGALTERLGRWRRAAELVLHAHEQGVIHRDLKPANFLQAPDGQIFLTDFGLAKVVGEAADGMDAPVSLTMTGVGFGTPPYMPPEQLEDAKRADQRADVFALGCMLFEVAALRLPYPGPTPTGVMGAHLKVRAGVTPAPHPRDVDPSVPEALDQACTTALELELERRCPSVATLLATLDGSAPTRLEHPPKSIGAVVTMPPPGEPAPATSSPTTAALPASTGPGAPLLSNLPTGDGVPTDQPRTPAPWRSPAPSNPRPRWTPRTWLVAAGLLLACGGAVAGHIRRVNGTLSGSTEQAPPATSRPSETPPPSAIQARLLSLSPTDGTVLPDLTVDVTGQVEPPTAAVWVDGIACPVGSNGTFTLRSLSLNPGTNHVVVELQPTGVGQEPLRHSLMLTTDPEDPRLVLQAPADAFETAEARVTVRGTVEDATAVEVSVLINGASKQLVARVRAGGGTFSATVSLPGMGQQAVEVVAKDAAGRTARVTRAVVHRAPHLQVAIDAPAPPGRPVPWSRGPTRLPAAIKKGDTDGEYVNERDGSVLLYVPPGTFHMGSDSGGSDEKPVHPVRFTRGYFVGKHEVSWGQFRAYCRARSQQLPPNVIDYKGRFEAADSHPVFYVTWSEAQAYCEWAELRLPTEAEWEYAARGGDGRVYPWGNEESVATRCNLGSGDLSDYRSNLDGHLYTAPVGSFPAGASAFGALDMAGNVWEWVQDWYADCYPSEAQSDPTGPVTGTLRAVRGDSWDFDPTRCRAAGRRPLTPWLRGGGIGFRVARSSEDP